MLSELCKFFVPLQHGRKTPRRRSFSCRAEESTMPNRAPMHLSPAERDALCLLLEREQKPAADAAERRLMRLRASVCTHLQALTFQASIIDGEYSSIVLSTDETDLVLDTLGPPSGPLAELQRRTANLHRRLIRSDMSALGTSGH